MRLIPRALVLGSLIAAAPLAAQDLAAVRVVDESQLPVAGAELVEMSLGSLRNDARALKTAGPDGVLLVEQSLPLSTGGTRYAVRADGFVTAFLADNLQSQTVTLTRGDTQTVRVLDQEGRPLAGLQVIVSRGVHALSIAELQLKGPVPERSGCDPEYYFRTQTTDSNGRATFDGLLAGQHLCTVCGEHRFQRREDYGVTVPVEEHSVTMLDAWGIVVKCSEPPLSVWGASNRGQVRPEYASAGADYPGVGRWLAQQFDDETWVYAGVPGEGVTQPKQRIALQFCRGERRVIEVAYGRLPDSPTVVELSPEDPSAPLKGGPLRFVWADRPDGLTDFNPAGFFLNGDRTGGAADVFLGGEVHLPFGTYGFGNWSPFAKEAFGLPEDFEHTAGTDPFEFRQTRGDLVPVRLNFVDTLGQTPPEVNDMLLQHECGWVAQLPSFHPIHTTGVGRDHNEFLCPPGKLTLTFYVSREKRRQVLTIPERTDPVQVVDLQLVVPVFRRVRK